MPEFSTKQFDLANNPEYTYYKLYVDGKCAFDDFFEEVERNIADKKSLESIIAYMDSLGALMIPRTKFNHIEGCKRKDLFEFKKDRLRVYVINQIPNIYIVMGGYKTTQKKDISKLIHKTKDFPEQDNQKE